MDLTYVPCDLCGADNARVRLRIPSRLYLPDVLYALSWAGWDPPPCWTLVECRRCGLVYTNPRVKDEDLHRLYPPVAYVDEETGGVRRKDPARWRSQLALVRRFRTAGRFLDVGCANGFLVQLAQESGFTGYGVDLSERAIQYAREMLGLEHVFAGALEDVRFPDDFFDVVTLYDVLEHVPSPRRLMAEAARITKPGGIAVVEVMSLDSLGARPFGRLWCCVAPAAHLTYFRRPTLERLVRAVGYEPVGFEGPRFIVGLRSEWARKRLLGRVLWRRWRTGATAYAERINPFQTVCFGGSQDLMRMVAEKR